MKAKPCLPLLFLLCITTAACGNDNNDPVVTFNDAGPADAGPTPDAAPCPTTVCEGVCVDTASDPLNCGGCGMACTSAGQICSGSLPCSCPAPFVPAQIGGSFDQIEMQGTAYIGISPSIGATIDVVAIVYDLSLDTAVEYNLADSAASLTPPAVAAGYDVDINNFTAHTAYAAFEGTIIFDQVCATGASGSITNAVFSEVQGVTNPTPVANGCTMSYTTLDFDVGSCPDGGVGDAGVTDGGVTDAGVMDGGGA